MNFLNDKILQTLEYRKILNTLIQYTQTSMGSARAEKLMPETDLEAVKDLLAATDQAYTVDRLKGNPSFRGITDINDALKRARIGGTLSPHELLATSNTIHGSRRIKRFIAAIHEDEKIEILYNLSDLISEQKPRRRHSAVY